MQIVVQQDIGSFQVDSLKILDSEGNELPMLGATDLTYYADAKKVSKVNVTFLCIGVTPNDDGSVTFHIGRSDG